MSGGNSVAERALDTDSQPTAVNDFRSRFFSGLMAEPGLLHRWITALITDEMVRQTGTEAARLGWRKWERETRLDDAGIGLDSLARLEVVGRLNEVFALSETGSEDYIFLAPTLGEWCDLVAHAFERRCDEPDLSLGFRTSGSTGTPRKIRHPLDALLAEVAAVAPILTPAHRIIAAVPPHHIYGCLFTILLPALTGAPVIDARDWVPGRLLSAARSGDLCVATPLIWELTFASAQELEQRSPATALTSSAPCPPAVWAAGHARVARMIELYGATDSGGIGWREAATEPFALLPHLERDADGAVRAPSGLPLPLQDHMDWEGPRRFRPAGRLDGAVQVGGINVFPSRLANRIASFPGVAECAVRPGANGRLKAFIVPDTQANARSLRTELRRFIDDALTAPERPKILTFGAALPRNEMGKLQDWS